MVEHQLVITGTLCSRVPIRGSTSSGGTTPRLDISNLDSLVGRYFAKGLAESTQRLYSSSQNQFLQFCREAGLQPLPASEAWTIKAYLSEVRFLHICREPDGPISTGNEQTPLHPSGNQMDEK